MNDYICDVCSNKSTASICRPCADQINDRSLRFLTKVKTLELEYDLKRKQTLITPTR